MAQKTRIFLLSFLILPTLVGCATYQSKVQKARLDIADKNYESAISQLEPLAKKEGVDQLVYLFDLASALQIAGRFEESNKYFHEADKMSDLKNYTSISKQGMSLLLSEELTQYKGEDFERLFINLFSAVNYIMLNDYENALVEVRRLNEKLEYYRIEEKKAYEQNPGALYLSAMMWEADKNWDSAYIDYERTYKRDPNITILKEDLVRSAKRAGRSDKYEKWSKEFNVNLKPESTDKSFGELVLIYQQGWGPRKAERERIMTVNGFVSPGLPKLEPVSTSTKFARLEVYDDKVKDPYANSEPALKIVDTSRVCSVQDVAIKTLEDAYAPLIAKRIAAYATKQIVANQVGKKNEGLGALLGFAMHVADRADLRQWSMLPESIQVARVYLKPGRYKVLVKGLNIHQNESGELMDLKDVVIHAGKKQFLNWRSVK